MTATERLSKWCKKHRVGTILLGPWREPGDEMCIELKSDREGIRINVGVYDDVFDCDEGGYAYPTIDQLINRALDLWDQEELKGGEA